MKLKHLFVATLAICIYTSCAKDNNGGQQPPLPDAKLTIEFIPQGVKPKTATPNASVKANDVNEFAGEANINNVAAAVFNQEGTVLYGHKWQPVVTENDQTRINNIPAKNDRVRIVIMANVPQDFATGVTTLTDLQNKLADLTTQKIDYLTMSSEVITSNTVLSANDQNYIGIEGVTNINNITTPLVLTRVPARISLVGAKTQFAGTAFEGRSVSIDAIYLANAKTKSKFFSVTDWGAVEAEGNFAYNENCLNFSDQPFAPTSAKVNYLVQSFEDPITHIGKLVNDNSSYDNIQGSIYTFENSVEATPTLIVIKATIQAGNNSDAMTRYFYIKVNDKGTTDGNPHKWIKRNYVYKVHPTFTDKSFPGAEEPGVAELNVEIKVENWNIVFQRPDLD